MTSLLQAHWITCLQNTNHNKDMSSQPPMVNPHLTPVCKLMLQDEHNNQNPHRPHPGNLSAIDAKLMHSHLFEHVPYVTHWDLIRARTSPGSRINFIVALYRCR